MDNSTKEACIELALADLTKQARPNFLGTARKFQVDWTTLQRRFQGTQQCRQVAHAENHQCLSIAQEETLIGYIGRLTDRSVPPTSQIVHNLAKELTYRINESVR